MSNRKEQNWDDEENWYEEEDWDKEACSNSVIKSQKLNENKRADELNKKDYSCHDSVSSSRVSTTNRKPLASHTETIDLKTYQIGVLIGKGGENIRSISKKFDVIISIDKKKLVATIKGKNFDNTQKAIAFINDQLNSTKKRQSRSYASNSFNKKLSDNKSKEKENFNEKNNESSFDDKKEESNEKKLEIIDWEAANKKYEEYKKKVQANRLPLKKNFYSEHSEVSALTPNAVKQLRKVKNNIEVFRYISSKYKDTAESLEDIPNPIWKFEHCFDKFPVLLNEIKKQNFEEPSPIQCQAWPVLIKGEDMIGIAQTGTGKTIAFILPALIHTDLQPIDRDKRGGANVLVLAPTRELVIQIEKEVSKFNFREIKSICIYGGVDINEQIETISKGVQVIIATPGRLYDLINRGIVNVSSITYLVLDEADRMLDLGFGPEILKTLTHIREDRQTIITSATWSPFLERFANVYMRHPIKIIVGDTDLAGAETVSQIIKILSDEEDKYDKVIDFLLKEKKSHNFKAIVFCGRKKTAEILTTEIAMKFIDCQLIHGAREQSDREQAIADITSGLVKVLIATDVASRGLDIPDVTHVINFDFPHTIEEYVHRVGRTGRAGKSGTSITYMTRSDWKHATKLINILSKTNQHVPSELRHMADRYEKNQIRKKY